jgi:atypical dual specificity phosphatase
MSLAFTWLEENQLAASACPMRGELLELQDKGIRVIVTLTETPLTTQTSTTAEQLSKFGFETLHAPIDDMEAPDETLARQVCRYIDLMLEDNKPVLLHCLGGIGRTGTLLHAYYLLKDVPFEDVKAKIKTVRPMSSFASLTLPQQTFLNRLSEKINKSDE